MRDRVSKEMGKTRCKHRAAGVARVRIWRTIFPVGPEGRRRLRVLVSGLSLAGLALATKASGDGLTELALIRHLQVLSGRVPVGDPGLPALFGNEGPKGLATADFDDDGDFDLAVSNLDGSVNVVLNRSGGDLLPPVHLHTGARSLREILAEDVDGDQKPDLLVAAPFDGFIVLLRNLGGGDFGIPEWIAAWEGVRNLAVGDFDGDGTMDLAAAGPGIGVRHFRGLGGGAFDVMGDLPISPADAVFPKPVYALKIVRSADEKRDDLLVSHEEDSLIYHLSVELPAAGAGQTPGQPQELPQDVTPPDATRLLLITEFMARNGVFFDGPGGNPDWIEVFNASDQPVSLDGWAVTDDPEDPSKSPLPSHRVLQPGEFLLVIADGDPPPDAPDGVEHVFASFKLKGDGEYLALTYRDRVVHAFPPGSAGGNYPPQVNDVSYGLDSLGRHVYFPEPSPGLANNSGVASLSEFKTSLVDTLRFDPAQPEPGLPALVEVLLVEPQWLDTVWLTTGGPGGTVTPLIPDVASASVYRGLLPAGAYLQGDPMEIAVQWRVDGRIETLWRNVDNLLPRAGCLRIIATHAGHEVRALEAAPLFTSYRDTGAVPDLVVVRTDRNSVEIRPGVPGHPRFAHIAREILQVASGPREVRAADMDGDGWHDLVVVQRDADRVLVFRNMNGTFLGPGGVQPEPIASIAVGASPRDLVLADFTQDGKPDAAVIHRDSEDLLILHSLPGSVAFARRDTVYALPAPAAGLVVADVNRDGRQDVLVVHRNIGQVSIYLAGDDRSLSPPRSLPFDGLPNGILFEDCNDDGEDDLIIPDLENSGSLVVYLGDGASWFQESKSSPLFPGNPRVNGASRGLLTAVLSDLDGDGTQDAVVSLYDCRIGFCRGLGDGTFRLVSDHELTLEFRRIVPWDFDSDGDEDFATVGYLGDVVLVENPGNLLESGVDLEPWIHRVDPGSQAAVGAREIAVDDIDGDGHVDLVVGSGAGALICRGLGGFNFNRAALPEKQEPAAGLLVADFVRPVDAAGSRPQIVSSCADGSCVTFSQYDDGGMLAGAVTVQVPAAEHLAAGDIDGDRWMDLVGADDTKLWVGHSSREPGWSGDSPPLPPRQQESGVLLNELNARNSVTAIASDRGMATDYAEILNTTDQTVELEGWTLEQRDVDAEGVPAKKRKTFPFPPGMLLEPGGRTLILFSDEEVTSLHTGFRLPGEGGLLRLLDSEGGESDAINYPAQLQDLAYCRRFDGSPRWVFSPSPTPGEANVDGGSAKPLIAFEGIDETSLLPNRPIRFFARAGDDDGVVGVRVIWRRLDQQQIRREEVTLFDDGKHGDGGMLDGLFAGDLRPGLPAGAEIEFFVEAVDLTGRSATMPPEAGFGSDDNVLYSLGIGEPGQVVITEVVSKNETILEDANGGTPGYVEVWNRSEERVYLDGFFVAQDINAPREEVYRFPDRDWLEPGERRLILTDGNPAEGPNHAPFEVSATSKEQVILFTVGPQGVRAVVDVVTVPVLGEDRAWTRFGDVWEEATASPLSLADAAVAGGRWASLASGERVWTTSVQTQAGVVYAVQHGRAGAGGTEWEEIGSLVGNGQVVTVHLPPGEVGELRLEPVIHEAPVSSLELFTIAPNAAEWKGVLESPERDAGAFQVHVFWDSKEGGADPAAWGNSRDLGRPGQVFPVVIDGLEPTRDYWIRLRTSTALGASAWSEPVSFRTLDESYPIVGSGEVSNASTRALTLTFPLQPSGESFPRATLVWGLRDAGLDAAAWDHAETILPSGALGNKFSFRVNGLEPGLEYSYRLHIESASGEEYWAPGAGRFRVLTELENLKLNLRVTEVNYHPGNPRKAEIQAGFVSDDDFEFIEFYNRGSEPLDLLDVSVQGEIRFSFREHALISQIPAGGFLLVTRERGAFQARYGREPLVAGQWCNPNSCKKLSNAGGTVSLVYREHEVFWTLTYDDEKKWPGQADGDGPTLELIDVSRPVENHEDPGAWRASQDPLGSPGFHAGIPATEFADWMKEAYPLEPDIDPFMPSERDGVPPVIRYALALDVTGRSLAESLLRVSLERLNGGQGLELSPVATVVLRGGLNSEQSGVYFGVEVSTDLIRWESQPLTEIENTVRPDGARTVRVRLPPARVDAPEMFVRLAFRLSPDP